MRRQAWNGINVAQTKPEDLKDDAVARSMYACLSLADLELEKGRVLILLFGTVELGSKLMIVQRVMFVSYLWCLKACIVSGQLCTT